MKKNLSGLAFVLIVWLCTVSGLYAQTVAIDDARVPNEFIVMLKPGCYVEQLLAEPALKNQLTLKECLSKRMAIYWLERNTQTGADDFLYVLQRNQFVKLAQFNHRKIEERSVVPNDPDFNLQWGMLNTGQLSGIPGVDIDATEAWGIDTSSLTKNGDTIVVAVIDKLFDLDHEDLNYYINRNEVPGNSIDDDGNGYIDDVNGWNATTQNGDVRATNTINGKHATHCAGIIGAKGNNATGVAGVCWGAKILPVYGSTTDEVVVVRAYDYVLSMRTLYNNTFGTQGAFIVATNSSFGVDNGNPVNYPIWCAMYDTMGYEGILSVAATSNNTGINVEASYDMPTSCPSPWLVGVTSISGTEFRNGAYGNVSIDMGAPGFGIQSTVYPNTYGSSTGTSMAAPHVAGTIAAMYGAACRGLIDKYYEQPDSIALLIKSYLLQATEWTSSMNNLTTTGGRLNLYRALMNVKQYNCDSCNFDLMLETVPISCKGANNGAMAVHSMELNIMNADVYWSSGLTTPECLNMEPGFYTVRVIDTATGCRRFINGSLHNPDSIRINYINFSPPIGGNNGSITVNAFAGNEQLQYSLDGANWQTTATLSVPAEGTYTVYIKNTTGCIVTETVVVSDVTELTTTPRITMYPNPASTEVLITSGVFDGKTPLQVFDITGRMVLDARPAAQVFNLNTADFLAGVYMVRIMGAEQKLILVK
ncbi:MAG TPA: S8 family serine peptidase [Chitinophagales bacterium]|nr:S8 family serine peptidase [Chitinophagales bacterium]